MSDENSSSQGNGGKSDGWLSRVNIVIGIVVALIGAWGSWITIQLDSIKSRLDVTSAERDWSGRIFDKYADAVTRERLTTEQRIATLGGLQNLTVLVDRQDIKLLMDKMIRDQLDSYAQQLKAAANAGAVSDRQQTEALAAQAEALATVADQSVKSAVARGVDIQLSPGAAALPAPGGSAAAKSTAGWSNYDFDLFWCETAPGAERIAAQLSSMRADDPRATGRWRVRQLSAATNARAGYGISGYVVRISSDDEKRFADAFVQAAGRRPDLGAQAIRWRIERVKFRTPYYLSVFICPA